MKYILNIVIGVFMLVLLGCNAKEEPANPHEDPKKEKTREEFIKENGSFENEWDIKRYNYLIRLMNDKFGFDMQEI